MGYLLTAAGADTATAGSGPGAIAAHPAASLSASGGRSRSISSGHNNTSDNVITIFYFRPIPE